jgi:predicted HicB family RNase H-like nuclease
MSRPSYGTSGRVELDEALIESLVKEAEKGYDVKRLRARPRPGRPSMGSEAAELFQVRLDPQLRKALTRAAQRNDISPSELTRRALRTYLKMLKISTKKTQHPKRPNTKQVRHGSAP